MSFDACVWLNPPQVWNSTGDGLRVVTDHGTDFWRSTYYGFTRDTGHFFGRAVEGDFTAQLRVQARYDALYDQAGIMIRVDEANWIKAGIEISDGQALVGSVLTRGASDWATGAYAGDPADFWIRVTVQKGALRLQVSPDGQRWPLSRLAPFPMVASYAVGPMCCTPERAGLEVAFSAFKIGPPLDKALHDLT